MFLRGEAPFGLSNVVSAGGLRGVQPPSRSPSS